ncbi:MAG: 50S ribosomal protein L24 [Patescibacteria group bacterium]
MIKKGNTVKILAGDDKGKTATVLTVLAKEGKVLVEGINMKKVHKKGTKEGQKGQLVEVSHPIHISNVSLVK